MNEFNKIKSNGTLTLNKKKIKGCMVSTETEAVFYNKKNEAVLTIPYTELKQLSNIRHGGLSSTVTAKMKDESEYSFLLIEGQKVYNNMDKFWLNKPLQNYSRADELRRLAELRGEKVQKVKKHIVKRRHPNRSVGGDIGIYIMLALVGLMMAFPLIFAVGSALKPLDELFRFPPTILPQHPTLDNFSDLLVTMGQSWVPFSRYLTNTVAITFFGTFGHLIIASMAAFVLAKYDFPGGKVFFNIVVTALMFSGYVTGIPNYVIMSKLKMIDTYWALLLPAFAAPIGLFMMKQFMEGLPTALIEAAHIDGAGEFRIFWSIVMPNVKPAWLTVIIFSVQSLWNNSAATVIYSEAKKTLVYALQQIQAGGIARTGQAAAVTVIVMAVPIIIFVLSQSQILETMASSGIKD